MKKHILLIPVLCAAFVACSNNSGVSGSYSSASSQTVSDQDLVNQVRDAIKYDTSISLTTRDSIQVVANKGEVTLSGMANSNSERDAVIRAANNVKGVKRVYSNITIAKSTPQS